MSTRDPRLEEPPMTDEDHARYLANWQDEIDSAYLYRTIADTEKDPKLAEVYRRLAAAVNAALAPGKDVYRRSCGCVG